MPTDSPKTFKTIGEHWAHFLEVDMPRDAPPVQVYMMKQAFAAGAISGLALTVLAAREAGVSLPSDKITAHTLDIRELNATAQRAFHGDTHDAGRKR